MEEQNIISLTYCFLDTNVLLHFQLFDNVDWPKVTGVQQCCYDQIGSKPRVEETHLRPSSVLAKNSVEID